MGLLDTLKSLLGLDGGSTDRRRSGRSSERTASDTEPNVTVERDSTGASPGETDTERPTPNVDSEAAVKEPVEEAEPAADAGAETSEAGGADGDGPTADGLDAVEEAETDEDRDATDDGEVADDTDEAVAADTSASGSTGSIVDADAADDPEQRAEAAETGIGTPDGDGDTDVDTDTDTDTDAEAEATPDPDTSTAESAAAGTDAAASTGSLVDADPDDATTAAEPGEAVGTPDDPDAGEAEAETDTDTDTDADTDDTSDPVEVIRGIGPAYGERLAGIGIETVAQLAAADPEELGARIDVSPSRVTRWVERANARLE
jgi:predicted flap endonuclease-1-like 5' DNA nuclease